MSGAGSYPWQVGDIVRRNGEAATVTYEILEARPDSYLMKALEGPYADSPGSVDTRDWPGVRRDRRLLESDGWYLVERPAPPKSPLSRFARVIEL